MKAYRRNRRAYSKVMLRRAVIQGAEDTGDVLLVGVKNKRGGKDDYRR